MRERGFPELIPFELPMFYAQSILRDFDVVHFHDLSNAISPLTVRYISSLKPTFWTFHDCSPFTGGCLFPFECERYKTRCGTDGGCPQLSIWPLESQSDHTGLLQNVKTSLHRTQRVHAIAGSNWIADVAMASGKVFQRPTVVPYSADTEFFRPIDDRTALRRELGLPADAPIVLVSASNVLDPRKGITYSIEALRSCMDLAPFALVIGYVDDAFREALGDLRYKATGYVTDQNELRRYYAVADVFLFCSLAETGPLSVVETMSCGTPFVGFAAGGIPDVVLQNETGIVVPQRDDRALSGALRFALTQPAPQHWRSKARKRIEEAYSYRLYTDRHLDLYEAART